MEKYLEALVVAGLVLFLGGMFVPIWGVKVGLVIALSGILLIIATFIFAFILDSRGKKGIRK